MKRKNMAVRLIRKRAGGFRVGEWLYLFECYDGISGETLRGTYEIREIKHHTEETVTFMAGHVELYNHGSIVVRPNRWLEFKRAEELHRIAGEPVLYIIREDDFEPV